jgi:hypothetical protein
MGHHTSHTSSNSLDLYFFTPTSIHACVTRLRDEYEYHRHIQLGIMPSDLVAGAIVVTLVYQRNQHITGQYSCLLRAWASGETLVQGPADVRLHRDRQHPFPSWTALGLGGLSWLILLGTALLLHHEAYRALAFAGFALFTGLAFLMMALMSKTETIVSSDTYLLRDLLKAALTAQPPRSDLAPTIPSASSLRQKRRPAHTTGRSPLATDKQRGHFPPPNNQQPPMMR